MVAHVPGVPRLYFLCFCYLNLSLATSILLCHFNKRKISLLYFEILAPESSRDGSGTVYSDHNREVYLDEFVDPAPVLTLHVQEIVKVPAASTGRYVVSVIFSLKFSS